MSNYMAMMFDRAVSNALVRHGGLTKDAAEAAVREGMIAGLEAFAWWKDGVQHVGTTGNTLRDALVDLDEVARRSFGK